MSCERHLKVCEKCKLDHFGEMKHLVNVTLGGRLSLQRSLEACPVCHCGSVFACSIPEENQLFNPLRGEMVPSLQSDATRSQEMACYYKYSISEGGENYKIFT